MNDRTRHDGANLRQRLEDAWTRVLNERMADVPILNAALRVEAVGAERWQQDWLTVLVTPWSINFMLVPGDASDWSALAPGTSVPHVFPSGVYSFIAACEPGFGHYQMCSLFSPVLEFDSHEAARIAAAAALDVLLAADDDHGGDSAAATRRQVLTGTFERSQPT